MNDSIDNRLQLERIKASVGAIRVRDLAETILKEKHVSGAEKSEILRLALLFNGSSADRSRSVGMLFEVFQHARETLAIGIEAVMQHRK